MVAGGILLRCNRAYPYPDCTGRYFYPFWSNKKSLTYKAEAAIGESKAEHWRQVRAQALKALSV